MKKYRVTNKQIAAACLPFGSTFLTIDQRRDILIEACKERGIEVSSVTPFSELKEKLGVK